jgi:hypothetical protein
MAKDRILYERRDGIRLRRQILDPHDDLPHVGAAKQPRPSASRAVTEGDERMFVAAGALLGITTESIRECLTRSTRPQTKPLRKRIVKTHRNVYRHVCIVAQRLHSACANPWQTSKLVRLGRAEDQYPGPDFGSFRTAA